MTEVFKTVAPFETITPDDAGARGRTWCATEINILRQRNADMKGALARIEAIVRPGNQYNISSAIDAMCDIWHESRAYAVDTAPAPQRKVAAPPFFSNWHHRTEDGSLGTIEDEDGNIVLQAQQVPGDPQHVMRQSIASFASQAPRMARIIKDFVVCNRWDIENGTPPSSPGIMDRARALLADLPVEVKGETE